MSQRLIHLSDELSLPLDIIVMRTATYGDSGAGKTTFARLLAEKMHEAKQRFCAIDLKNDWWGLKSSADGKSAGIPIVVFGGPRADVKLLGGDKFSLERSGATLAETVASIDQSVILDLDAMNRLKQEQFLASFLDHLYEVNRRPMLLFADEADRYAPQKPMTDAAIASLGSSEDIARRGRKRGIGSLWLTQRTAVLNKNVSEFANLAVIFRTPGSRDLAELEDRVGRIAAKEVVKEVVKQAPGLGDGVAFFLSAHPKLRKHLPDPPRPIQLPMPRTFDSSATPGVGQRRREPKVLARADLAAIESKMAESVEQAKASDPAALRVRVMELQTELAAERKKKLPPPPAPPPAPKEKRVEVQVLKNGQLKRAERIMLKLTDVFTKAQDLVKATSEIVTPITQAVNVANAPAVAEIRSNQSRPLTSQMTVTAARSPVPPPAPPPARAPSRTVKTDADAGGAGGAGENGTLDKPTKKILAGLAWWRAAGVTPSVEQLAPAAQYTPSGSFDTYLSNASKSGLLVRARGVVNLTDEGLKHAPAPPPAEEITLEKLHAMIIETLDGPGTKIIKALIGFNSAAPPLADLAAAAGYTPSGSFDTYLSALSRRGLIVRVKGAISPTAVLFPPELVAAELVRR